MGGMRGWVFGLAIAGLAAGCDRQPAAGQAPGAAVGAGSGVFLPFGAAQQGAGLHLAYTHEVELAVPAGVMAAHYMAARDACLTVAARHCLLLQAEIGRGEAAGAAQTASVRVRLPHDQVADYSALLTGALPGEAAGLVRVTREASTADDLGQPAADAGQRVAQLSDYLASLKVLGARLTISVSDQVKIAEETARTQTQLEEAQTLQRALALRVDTEEVDVGFMGVAAPVQAGDPVAGVLAGAQGSLRRNAAEALGLGIAALPWVPLGLVGVLVLWVVRRVVVGRRDSRRAVGL